MANSVIRLRYLEKEIVMRFRTFRVRAMSRDRVKRLLGPAATSLLLGCSAAEDHAASSAGDDFGEEVATTEQKLINGYVDYGDINRNASVWVSGCSGTLVAPDMVLTAGHCLDPDKPDWADDPIVGKGTWRPMGPDRTVRVGPNPASPIFSTAARWANSAGLSDIALLLLVNPVPGTLVRPARIMTAGLYTVWGGLDDKTLYQASYGSECSGWLSGRKFGYVRYEGGSPRGVNSFVGRILNYGEPQVLWEQGDSGAPLFWWNPWVSRLYVAGVAVGWSGTYDCADAGRIRPHFVGTFMTGDATRPDISAWLTEEVTPSLRRNTFQPSTAGDRWHHSLCFNDETCGIGDFDSDGKHDIIAFTRDGTGDVYVGLSYGFRTQSSDTEFAQRGNGFETTRWHTDFSYGVRSVGVIDIDRDGRDDVFYGIPSGVWIARSTGTGFGASYRATSDPICRQLDKTCIVGNVRVGGGEDIVSIDQTSGVLALYRSDRTNLVEEATFDTSLLTGLCSSPRLCKLADYDFDGDDDVIIFHNDINGHVDVSRNLRSGFGLPERWVDGACFNWVGDVRRDCSLGDVNGDGLPDLVIAEVSTARVHVVRNGSGTTENNWHTNLCGSGHQCMSGDFDGDGLDDIVDFARSASPETAGDVFVQSSIATY